MINTLFDVIYNTLTDAELRLAVDNAPECLPALQEAARRWCEPPDDETKMDYDEGYEAGYDEGYRDGLDT